MGLQEHLKALKEKEARLETILAQIKFKIINSKDEQEKKLLKRIYEANEISYRMLHQEVRSTGSIVDNKARVRHFIVQEVDENFIASQETKITDLHIYYMNEMGKETYKSRYLLNDKNTIIISINTGDKNSFTINGSDLPIKKKFSNAFKKISKKAVKKG
jgi:hypothetical protein